MTGEADARHAEASTHLWVTGGLALAGIAAGLATGWLVVSLGRPSTDELQRVALEEVGLPPELESAPVIGPALDGYTERIERRVIEESRTNAVLALAVGAATASTVTVGLLLATGRGRHHRPDLDPPEPRPTTLPRRQPIRHHPPTR